VRVCACEGIEGTCILVLTLKSNSGFFKENVS